MPKTFVKLNKNVVYLGLVSLFTDISTEMSYPLIPVFLKEALKASVGFIGIVEAIAESTASLTKILAGYLSDRLRKRKLLIFLGYALSTSGKPFLAAATAGWHVLAVRFVDRLGKGIRTAPRDALIADSSDKGSMGRAFGFHRAADTLGAVAGPLIALALLPLFHGNYRPVFLLAFIPGLVAVAISMLLVRDIRPEARPANSAEAETTRFDLSGFDRRFKLFLLCIAVFTLGNSSDAFLILRARDLGVPMGLIPLLWLCFNVTYFVCAYPAGMLSDRVGRQKTIMTGLLLYGLVYAALAFARIQLHAWLLFAAYGLYYGLVYASLKAFIADLIPSDKRATAYGVYATVVGVTVLPANLLMGFFWQFLGFQFAFLFSGAMALLAAILFIILLRR